MMAKMAAWALVDIEGAGLERGCEDKKCGEIFDGTHLLPSLSSFKKVLPCMVQKI